MFKRTMIAVASGVLAVGMLAVPAQANEIDVTCGGPGGANWCTF